MTTWTSDMSIPRFAAIVTFAFIVAAGCFPSREINLVVEVRTMESVGVLGRTTHISQLSSQIKARKFPPSRTKVILCCARESKHFDLLRVERCLSTLGFFDFNIQIEKTSIPVRFGPMIDFVPSSEDDRIAVIRVDISNKKEDLSDSNMVKLKSTVYNSLYENKKPKVCFEVYCSTSSDNSILLSVLNLLQKFPNEGIYIVTF